VESLSAAFFRYRKNVALKICQVLLFAEFILVKVYRKNVALKICQVLLFAEFILVKVALNPLRRIF